MPMHKLKTWPEPFKALLDGLKTYEVRHNDRNFHVGDELQLCEWSPVPFRNQYGTECDDGYTGRIARFLVVYMTAGGRFGLPDDLCVMAIRPLFVCERCGGVAISVLIDGIDSKIVCNAYPQCVAATGGQVQEETRL
jgi:hypothetical protein